MTEAQKINNLKKKIAALHRQLETERLQTGGFSALSLTELILENSSAILFRRLAATDPKKRKMVYVSPNISCFGYRAEDFLQGKIMFRDIVYPDDSDRTLQEIKDYVDQEIENYCQTYRIVTKDGDVRWIEDRTSIYQDETTGLRYHQGIVIDIHEQKKALQLAAEVQKSLLPENSPNLEWLDIAGKTFSCDEVGGDYFDYLPGKTGEENSLSIIIGDITGHGVDAALLMASARAFLRMRASQPGCLEDIVTAMNHHLTGDMEKTSRFMTLFYLCLEQGDRENKKVRWIRAGHDPALCYDPTNHSFTELKGPGIALGIDRDYPYRQQQMNSLSPGHILVLTTDGIYEAHNHKGEMFGKKRLQSIVQNSSNKNAKVILNSVMEEHFRFTAGLAREDDITLVIIKIL